MKKDSDPAKLSTEPETIEPDSKEESSIDRWWRAFGSSSFILGIVMVLMTLNWIFQIIPNQGIQGMSLLLSLYVSPIGIFMGYLSSRKIGSKYGKWAMILHSVLFILPIVYFIVGTLVFGS